MAKIKIELLEDYNDSCELGCGGSEEGARVWIDGELKYELIPRAGCFSNNHYGYNKEKLFEIVLGLLGHEVEILN